MKRSRTPKSAPVLPIPPEKAEDPEVHTEAEEPGAKKRPTLPTPPEKADGPEVHTETEEPPTDEKEPPAGGSCTSGRFLTS